MPDFTTHSLKSLQNPQEHHKPIPCLRDQNILQNQFRQNLCNDPQIVKQREAYENEACKHAYHFIKPAESPPQPEHKDVHCTLGVSYNHSAFQPKNWMDKEQRNFSIPGTNIHPERVSTVHDYKGCMTYDSFMTGNADLYPNKSIIAAENACKHELEAKPKPDSKAVQEASFMNVDYTDLPPPAAPNKSVTWVNEKGGNITSFCHNPSLYMNLNSNNNNNFEDKKCYKTPGRKQCNIGGPVICNLGCNAEQAMKRSQDFHYLKTENGYCICKNDNSAEHPDRTSTSEW